MQTVQLLPGKVQGRVAANISKSAMQRACAAALIKKGTTLIKHPGKSNDDLAAIDIITKLGATVHLYERGNLLIKSNGVKPVSNEIFCGESGLSIRMFTPIAAISPILLTVTGSGSLVQRPMDFFDEIFPQLGVSIQTQQGKLPMHVKGILTPADIIVDGSLSSQFLTGLLFAYSAVGADKVTVQVNNLKSAPYIDLTLQIMGDFGLQVPTNTDYTYFKFERNAILPPTYLEYQIEGDWSGASFLLVAAAVAGGNVKVEGIFSSSKQADKAILKALQLAGAGVAVGEDYVIVQQQSLAGFEFDATDCPDLFPPLVALAAYCKGTTSLHGLLRLKHKESDRGLTLQAEFAKLGVEITLEGDTMFVHGTRKIEVLQQELNSHHDHRIAMAVAVAGLAADKGITINNADAINKSYPDFWLHLQQLGANVVM